MKFEFVGVSNIRRVPIWLRERMIMQSLDRNIPLHMTFVGYYSRQELRDSIYAIFGGHRIDIQYRQDEDGEEQAICIVSPERIRTSATHARVVLASPNVGIPLQLSPTESGSVRIVATPGTQRPKQASTQERIQPSSAAAVPDGFQDVVPCKKCPVCGQYLPLDHFSTRMVSGKDIRQSYCRQCNQRYLRWRREFLKEHQETHLKPNLTQGTSPNEDFLSWLSNLT